VGNPVVHFEILGPDGQALQGFYRSLFDWTIDTDNPSGYGMVTTGEGAIGGGVSSSADGSSQVSFYVQVDSLQEYLDKAETLGAKTLLPPTEVPGGPVIAMFADPQGNRIGLVGGM